MLKKIKRKIKKNPLDILLQKAKKNNHKKFLLAWNRALGDISLGLYAVIYRIRQYIPDAKITFLIRKDLSSGFELLEGIDYIKVSFWQRNVPFDIYNALNLLEIDPKKYDVIIDKVDPNYWVKWQRSVLTPKLKWNNDFDKFVDKFHLPANKVIIGVQPSIETKHSLWRSYPKKYFDSLFSKACEDVVFVLFGNERKEKFDFKNVIDLRGKTTLLDVLSILKNRCDYFISLDSGILSLFYYLDIDCPIKLIALWGSKDVGVIKQNVKSPNKNLMYIPMLFENGLDQLKPSHLREQIYLKDIENILKQNGQDKILKKFRDFSIQKKKLFLKEIFSLDLNVLKKQKAFFKKPISINDIKPLKKSKKANAKDKKKGQKIIEKKKVALIVLAAGQGSRLGFNGPKGLFKILGKTLFEHLFEKIKTKQKKLNVKLNICIMTSHQNHEKIIRYFEKNNNFGFEKCQIDFFMQSDSPFLDEDKNWLIEDDKILKAPDGNGSIFRSFCESNIYFKYKTQKIKYVSVIPIDNLLLDPFDEAFIGFHSKYKNDITIKCIRREANEKTGAIATADGKIKIIEYIYLNKKQNAKALDFRFSNSGIYLINLKVFQKLKDIDLKYQFVKKRVKNDKDIFAYKAESFIFDGFEYVNKIMTMVDEKQNFYAPLKDKKSLETVEKLLCLEKSRDNMLK